MKIFELQFNPKEKKDKFFEVFYYEPKEQKTIGLYLVGELRNSLPQNYRLLNKIGLAIKEKYHLDHVLENNLKQANELLSSEAMRGNIDWMGNLNIGIVSLLNSEINFTKTGDTEIILLKKEDIIDLGKSLENKNNSEETIKLKKTGPLETYSPNVFNYTVSYKINHEDIVLLISKDVFRFFLKEKVLEEISKSLPLTQEKLEEILKKREKELKKISGACLLLYFEKETVKKELKLPQPSLTKKDFSYKEVFLPILSFFKKIIGLIKKKLPKLKPKKTIQYSKENIKRSSVLIFLLVFILIMGTYFFQQREKQEIKKYEAVFSEIEQNLLQADSQNGKHFTLLIDSKERLTPLIKIKSLSSKALDLMDQIDTKLEIITNKTTKDPELIIPFSEADFAFRKMFYAQNSLYLFHSFLPEITKIDLNTLEQTKYNISLKLTDQQFIADLIYFSNQIYLFVKPDKILSLETQETAYQLQNTSLEKITAYATHLYFWDSLEKEIIKYSPLSNSYTSWFSPETKKPDEIRSLAIDGAIWLINKDNSISRYFIGSHQKTLSLNIFPEALLDKIIASDKLYILDSNQSRVIVLEKDTFISQTEQSIFPLEQIHISGLKKIKDALIISNKLYLLDESGIYLILL